VLLFQELVSLTLVGVEFMRANDRIELAMTCGWIT